MDSIQQSLVPTSPSTITVRHLRCQQAGEVVRRLLDVNPAVVGLSVGRLLPTGVIESIAFATSKEVFLLKLETGGSKKSPLSTLDLSGILDKFNLAAFNMAQVALHIFRGSRQHVRGVDLSTLLSSSTKKPWQPSRFVTQLLCPEARKAEIDRLWDSDPECGSREVCLRAWLSASAAERCVLDIANAIKVNTRNLQHDELEVLGKMCLQAALLRNDKPTETENEFSSVNDKGQGEVILQNSRYKNRARPSFQTSIVMTNGDGQEFVGRAQRAEGKATTIQLHQGQGNLTGTVSRIRIVGREELTGSERARDEFILLVLRGERILDDSLFIRFLWFPSLAQLPKATGGLSSTHYTTATLNKSQSGVVTAMLTDQIPLVVVHGPPGTGKTSTISATVKIWDNYGVPVWITAQSNVAVKNIAESLLKHNVDFKLIVSKDFYVEWHEHIYEKIEQNLLRSDEFPPDLGAMERTIGGSPVILCTLSMLSNPILDDSGLYDLVPLDRLVIDEASQIDVGEFMHLFHKFKKLQKVCFFGDPKQLPPYGKDSVKSLQTIFDIKHLRSQSYFLNTQYRMPVPLGAFISDEVYDAKLNSEHRIRDMDCVAFVDATKGQEEKCGTSWRNQNEIQTIVHLVRHYYLRKDFCVITPYDAQRAALEKQLKAEGLPWERVFNVDSFQGNEAEYVIISVVRTTGPGFLSSQNRVNVMLTRCKSGMVIVTNRVFLRTTGAQFTLLGGLVQYWTARHGESKTWTNWKDVVEAKANMPGVLGPHRVIPSSFASTTITPLTLSASRPQAPIGMRLPASPTAGTEPKSVISSHATDDFPVLGVSKSSKPTTTQGRWNSPAGVSAIKRVAASSVPLTSAHSLSSGYTLTPPSPAVSPRSLEQKSHGHFPSRGSHQGTKKAHVRRKI